MSASRSSFHPLPPPPPAPQAELGEGGGREGGAGHKLLEADYLEWQRLAEAEGEAIRAGDWLQACDCQNALKGLQPRIIEHASRAQQEWGHDEASRNTSEPHLRALVRHLIELEQRNSSLLDRCVRSARAELDKLQQANHTLSRIQRSYAPSHPAGWSSFS